MKYYVVWKTESSAGLLKNKEGKVPTFKTPEKALNTAKADAEYYAKKGGFRRQDPKKMKIVSYDPSDWTDGRVSMYDTDDVHQPPDNWIEYIIVKSN